jgi:hypothetical protein
MDANAVNLELVKDLLSEKVLRGLRAFQERVEDAEDDTEDGSEDDTEDDVDLLGYVSAIV